MNTSIQKVQHITPFRAPPCLHYITLQYHSWICEAFLHRIDMSGWHWTTNALNSRIRFLSESIMILQDSNLVNTEVVRILFPGR